LAVIKLVDAVTAVADVLFVIARVVNAEVVVLPEIIALLAVNEVAPVPPCYTSIVVAFQVPVVTVPTVVRLLLPV